MNARLKMSVFASATNVMFELALRREGGGGGLARGYSVCVFVCILGLQCFVSLYMSIAGYADVLGFSCVHVILFVYLCVWESGHTPNPGCSPPHDFFFNKGASFALSSLLCPCPTLFLGL